LAPRLAQTDEEARSLKRRLAGIELTACSMADAMQFGFLLDGERRFCRLATALPRALWTELL